MYREIFEKLTVCGCGVKPRIAIERRAGQSRYGIVCVHCGFEVRAETVWKAAEWWNRCNAVPVILSEHLKNSVNNDIINYRANPYHDPETGRFTSKNNFVNSIEIDTLTNCLINIKTGKEVETEFQKVSPKKTEYKDWEFDWSKPEKNGYSVYALKAKGDERVQGLVSLKVDKSNMAVNVDIVEAAPHNNLHNKNNKTQDKVYDGVGGHLFAEACRQSKEAGFDGFVYFEAKTNLIEHYKKTIGAEQINRSQKMFIDEDNAQKLINKYYGGK